MKKSMTKKSMPKANNGRIVRSKVVDPEENIIKTKTNTRTGATKTVVKYKDPKSSGMRREVTRTPGLTRAQIKANEYYANNPQAAMEDDFKPYTPGKQKEGGPVMKKKMTKASKGVIVGMNTSVKNQTNPGSKGVKTGANTPVSATPKAKYGMTMKKKRK